MPEFVYTMHDLRKAYPSREILKSLTLAFLPGALRPRYATGRGSGLAWLGVAGVFAALWVSYHPDLRVPATALGLFWMLFGWRTWHLQADRRARALALFALVTPFIFWLL